MQRLPVESSDIVSIGYDPHAQVLEIEFKGGRVYQYADVEQHVYDLFIKADSFGEYFYAQISKRYRYKKVASETESGKPVGGLTFATGNQHKFAEAQAALQAVGIDIQQLDVQLDEIQSHEAEQVALYKAKQAHKLSGRPVFVEDSFWNIVALRGFPGAFMSYVADWLKAEDFIALMAGKADRTVICTQTVVFYDGKRSKVFSQDHLGIIADAPRGKGRYSIDEVVVPAGQNLTLAEIHEQDSLGFESSDDGVWQAFAKWCALQRRLGKV